MNLTKLTLILQLIKSFLIKIVSSKLIAKHTSELSMQFLLIFLNPKKSKPALFADFLISKITALGIIFCINEFIEKEPFKRLLKLSPMKNNRRVVFQNTFRYSGFSFKYFKYFI